MNRLTMALVPADLRERYAEEWAANLAGAQEAGVPELDIRRGARHAALRLRLRRIGDVLAWRRGPVPAIAGYIVILPILALTVTGPIALALGILAQWYVLHVVKRRRFLLLGLVAVQVLGVGVGYWLFGVGVGYADANLPMPVYTEAWGPSLLAALAATVAFWIIAASGPPQRPSR